MTRPCLRMWPSSSAPTSAAAILALRCSPATVSRRCTNGGNRVWGKTQARMKRRRDISYDGTLAALDRKKRSINGGLGQRGGAKGAPLRMRAAGVCARGRRSTAGAGPWTQKSEAKCFLAGKRSSVGERGGHLCHRDMPTLDPLNNYCRECRSLASIHHLTDVIAHHTAPSGS